jgi:hypothetical protein
MVPNVVAALFRGTIAIALCLCGNGVSIATDGSQVLGSFHEASVETEDGLNVVGLRAFVGVPEQPSLEKSDLHNRVLIVLVAQDRAVSSLKIGLYCGDAVIASEVDVGLVGARSVSVVLVNSTNTARLANALNEKALGEEDRRARLIIRARRFIYK